MPYFRPRNILGVTYKLTQCPHIDRLSAPVSVIVNKRKA
jgi:hypothetical protein